MSTTVDEYPATERSRASLPPVPDGAVMLNGVKSLDWTARLSVAVKFWSHRFK